MLTRLKRSATVRRYACISSSSKLRYARQTVRQIQSVLRYDRNNNVYDIYIYIWQDGFKLRDYRKAETDISLLGDKIYIYIYIYMFIYYLLSITYYILPIDCLLIALDAHIFSHNGYGPKAQRAAAPGPGPGPAAPWALGLGPGPISIKAEHMCIKGNQ